MIQRHGNGARPWRARHKLRGVGVQRSFATKKQAEEWLRAERETYAREQSGLAVHREAITYDALCDLYLDNYTAKSKTWLEGMLQHSRDRFGSLLVHLLRPDQIGRWLHTELAHLSPKTRSHILTAMRQVLNAGVEWSYLQQSPARPRAVNPPPKEEPDVRPLESWEEVLRVAAVAGHYGPLIRFACATGLRPQEWAQLEWSDIDREARVLNVKGKKTERSRRAVVLSRPALAALDDVLRRIDTPLVFTTSTGRPISSTKRWGQKVWRPCLAALGLAHRPSYQMRHTYATLALAQGCSLEWISDQMGHSSLEITRRHYARFVKRVDDRMRALLDQMEEQDAERDIALR